MGRHGKVMVALPGRPKVGQHVAVQRRIRYAYRYDPDTRPQFYFEQGVVEVVRKNEAVVRLHGYELTVPWSDLQVLVKNFSKRWTRPRLPR